MLDYRVHTFLAVYRLQSFTKAAEHLHITQPAASQHIRHLEAHYGTTLFTTRGRAMHPTAAGDLLFQRLSVMENDERRICDEVLAAGTAQPAPLRLGCTRTVADYTAPRIIAVQALAHPHQRITLRGGNTHELMDALADGSLDVALVEGPFDRQAFDGARLTREKFIAVAGCKASPAAHAERSLDSSCALEDLLPCTLILREPGSGSREILERNLAAHGIATNDFADVIELASIPAIKACVAAGVGISFMYQIAVEHELREGTLRDITPRDLSISHDFTLIWQRGSLYAERYRALAQEWRAAI